MRWIQPSTAECLYHLAEGKLRNVYVEFIAAFTTQHYLITSLSFLLTIPFVTLSKPVIPFSADLTV